MKRRPSNRPFFPTLAALVLACSVVGGLTGPVSACPNCKVAYDKKDATKSEGDGNLAEAENRFKRQRIGKGYNWSIILMMPLPFLLLAGLGGMLYWQVRKHAPDLDSGLSSGPEQSTGDTSSEASDSDPPRSAD